MMLAVVHLDAICQIRRHRGAHPPPAPLHRRAVPVNLREGHLDPLPGGVDLVGRLGPDESSCKIDIAGDHETWCGQMQRMDLVHARHDAGELLQIIDRHREIIKASPEDGGHEVVANSGVRDEHLAELPVINDQM